MIRHLKCLLGLHSLESVRIGERICRECGARYLIAEVERNNMRCGRWFYVGKASPSQRAALAAVEGQQ